MGSSLLPRAAPDDLRLGVATQNEKHATCQPQEARLPATLDEKPRAVPAPGLRSQSEMNNSG